LTKERLGDHIFVWKFLGDDEREAKLLDFGGGYKSGFLF
jgi:hypothetical protein